MRRSLSPGLIYNVQILRAFAALLVVFLHVTSVAGLGLPISVGHYGVDIFFIISGFIIPYIALGDAAGIMMLKRIIRIVPVYWAATLGLFFLSLVAPSLLHSTDASPASLLHSLFFLPYAAHGDDPLPLLINGWTLNYEMYFYLLFALGLWLMPRYAPWFCALAVIAVMVLVDMSGVKEPDLAFYGNPIVLEFILGMAVFGLYRRFTIMRAGASRDDGFFVPLLCLTAAVLIFLPAGELIWGGWQVVWLRGMPAAVLLLSLVTLERRYRLFSRNQVLLLLGEASYVLYLLHPYIIFAVLRLVLPESKHWSQTVQWLLVLPLLAVASAAALLVHIYFEKPVMKWLRGRLLHKAQPVIFTTADP